MPEAAPTVLFVCTANVCRSPMAETLLVSRLHMLDAPAHVRSAGLRAMGGPADATAGQVLAARGLDLSHHESTGLTEGAIAGATLILAMERAHVAEISTMAPGAFAKTFGLTEIVALGERHGRRRDDETIAMFLSRLNVDRGPADVVRAATSFDIADPHGRSTSDYAQCADELTRLIESLVVLFGWSPKGRVQ